MQLFKKIDKYLLENHPLTWHTKFIQLVLAGLLFWLISYICGYSLVNLRVLKEEYLSAYYSESYFISFHVIYCLIVTCIWAIFFYKNNAIKSFYPLQRFYFVKLFLQLFAAFSLLVSAYYPFTLGAVAKARSILPVEEVERDIDKVNTGSVFLMQNKSDYYFLNRKEVKALNLNSTYYEPSSHRWADESSYLYYPELLNEQYVPEYLERGEFGPLADSNATVIDNARFLFFSSVLKYTGKDSCSSYDLITGFHKLNIRDLHKYALINYNTAEYNYLDSRNRKSFRNNRLPEIRSWIENGRKDSIENAIDRFIDVYVKYKIDFNLDTKLVSKYLSARNYINIEDFFEYGGDDFRERDFAINNPHYYALIMKYSNNDTPVAEEDLQDFIYAVEKQGYLFYGSSLFDRLINNYMEAYYPNIWDRYSYIAFMALAFGLAWLFLWFEFTNIVSLLISIPIGGALTILVGIIIIYVNLGIRYESGADYRLGEKMSIVIMFFVCLLILLTTLLGLFRKSFNKRVLNILINLSYVIAPGFIVLFLGMINILSGKTVFGKCDSDYVTDFDFLFNPLLIMVYCFAGVFCFFPWIRKWRAREE